jgi:hypothetical protein
MIDTVTEHTFTDVMTNKYNNFSYEGAKALYNYLEQYEEDTGTQIEFDPVALRCEYSEYENLNEIIQEYESSYLNIKYGVHEGIKTLEDLQEQTTVILINNSEGIIIQNF